MCPDMNHFCFEYRAKMKKWLDHNSVHKILTKGWRENKNMANIPVGVQVCEAG